MGPFTPVPRSGGHPALSSGLRGRMISRSSTSALRRSANFAPYGVLTAGCDGIEPVRKLLAVSFEP